MQNAEGFQGQSTETNLPKPTEVPYISAIKALTRERMPQQADDFDNFFNAINGELMGNDESRGSHYLWK